jgi:type II secretory pathway predicted ATPase ExeA
MYDSHFGLRRRPFRPTPDTDAYYPATTHEAALDQLVRAFNDEEGLFLLTGNAGMGKTLLARRMLESLDEEVRTVLLTNSHFSGPAGLLLAILFDLGLPYRDLTEQRARIAVTESCLETFQEGGSTLIVVDEAHHLNVDILEELRLLSNLEGKTGKAVQVLLVGLPKLEETLDCPDLALLRQRMTTRTKLEPLSLEESADYLMHQVRVAGGEPKKLYGADVLDILSYAANGVPRILNQAAHLAFQYASEGGTKSVDSEAAVEAVTQLGLDPVAEEEARSLGAESVRLVPTRIMLPEPEVVAVDKKKLPIAEKVRVLSEPPVRTIPFVPTVVPAEDYSNPPTYVYGDDGPDLIGPERPGPVPNRDPWGAADRAG